LGELNPSWPLSFLAVLRSRASSPTLSRQGNYGSQVFRLVLKQYRPVPPKTALPKGNNNLTLNSSTCLTLATLAALGLAAAATPAAASVLAAGPSTAFTFTGGTARTDFAGYTIGYGFTTGSSAVTLASLGYYGGSAPVSGLTENHEVGLFTTGGTQLADATVAAGTAVTANNFAFTTSVTDLSGFTGTLAANTSYVLAGFTGTKNTDPFLQGSTAVGSPAGFTFGHPYYEYPTTGFVFPTSDASSYLSNSYAGPNLQIAAPVPEAASSVALGLLLALGGSALCVKKIKGAKSV